ncbi:unnamed protein product, partial [Didymodactylos carnosus]
MGNRESKHAESHIRIVLGGSLAEGYHDTKFMTGDALYEYDCIYVLEQEIQYETQLQPVEQVLGYFKIFWTNRLFPRFQHDNGFLDGYDLKKEICSIIDKQKNRPLSLQVSIDNASICIQDRCYYDYDENVFDKINQYRTTLKLRDYAIAERNLKLFTK